MPEPITLGGVEVEDAFVDWNRNCANTPTLQLILSESMNRDDWLPLPDAVTRQFRTVFSYDGVWRGFDKGDSFENRRTYDKLTESGEEVTGTWSYHHTIKRHIDSPTIAATLSTSLGGSPSTFNVDLATARRAVIRYINDDVNRTGASYWVAKRDPHGWSRATSSREQWDGYEECDVALVEGDVYEYRPKRIIDVNTDDNVAAETVESAEVDV